MRRYTVLCVARLRHTRSLTVFHDSCAAYVSVAAARATTATARLRRLCCLALLREWRRYRRIPTDAHATFAVSSAPAILHMVVARVHPMLLPLLTVVSHSMTNVLRSKPVEVCWRVIEASTTRILTCAIFAAPNERVELRVGYFGGAPLHSQMLRDIGSARVLARHWRDAVRCIELRT